MDHDRAESRDGSAVTADLSALLSQYRAGLEAEINLLTRLEHIASRQRSSSNASDFPALAELGEERDRLMAGLVVIEQELSQARKTLAEHQETLASNPEFEQTVHLYRGAMAMVKKILSTDEESLAALAAAEAARRATARALAHGEVTLEAYRRLAATPLPATLVDRRG